MTTTDTARLPEAANGTRLRCDESAFPRFTAWRVAAGLSKRQLADRMLRAGWPAGDPFDLIRRIEQHGQRPTPAFLVTLARAAGLSIEAARELLDDRYDQPTVAF